MVQHAIMHLSLIQGVGPATIHQIVGSYQLVDQIDTSVWYQMNAVEWSKKYHLSIGIAQRIVDGLKDRSMLEKELFLIEKHAISWVTCVDAAYPYLLKNIHIPPAILYWKGTLPAEKQAQAMALVGSRKADQYGKRVTKMLTHDLVGHSWTIVSGGAIGVDTFAHQETINAGGKTVAVLGSGLLVPYPSSNSSLFNAAVELGGAVVSIFPLKTAALPGNFPARNRVIAGLSRGCVVVQAAQKSGARITAQYALDQGRDVFAVPGLIDDPLSVGCHELVQSGAKLIKDAQDILIEYGAQPMMQTDIFAQNKQKMVVSEPETIIPDTSIEGQVVRLCKQGPCCVDDLIEQTKLSLAEIQTLLFDLQLEGLVFQTSTGQWTC